MDCHSAEDWLVCWGDQAAVASSTPPCCAALGPAGRVRSSPAAAGYFAGASRALAPRAVCSGFVCWPTDRVSGWMPFLHQEYEGFIG